MASRPVSGAGDGLAVAIDLGGTQIRAALIDRRATILARAHQLTRADAGPEIVIGQIAELWATVCEGTNRSNILGIGVSSPGPLDTREGIALGIPTLAGFEDFPLKAALSEKLSMPVMLENDGISAGIGEWRYGAGKGLSDIVYVTVSTGIGGGVIIGNRVLRGRRGMAGHIGHMSFVRGGELCACGNRGCFEAYASATAFTRRAVNAATPLGNHGRAIDAAAVFASAAGGDALAISLVQEEAEYLGQGFASLLHLYDPDMLIMGGGLSNQFDMLQGAILSSLKASAMPAFRGTPVVRAILGANSGLIGAASLVLDGP
jgi:glucokinase